MTLRTSNSCRCSSSQACEACTITWGGAPRQRPRTGVLSQHRCRTPHPAPRTPHPAPSTQHPAPMAPAVPRTPRTPQTPPRHRQRCLVSHRRPPCHAVLCCATQGRRDRDEERDGRRQAAAARDLWDEHDACRPCHLPTYCPHTSCCPPSDLCPPLHHPCTTPAPTLHHHTATRHLATRHSNTPFVVGSGGSPLLAKQANAPAASRDRSSSLWFCTWSARWLNHSMQLRKCLLLHPATPCYPSPRGKFHTRSNIWSFTVG